MCVWVHVCSIFTSIWCVVVIISTSNVYIYSLTYLVHVTWSNIFYFSQKWCTKYPIFKPNQQKNEPPLSISSCLNYTENMHTRIWNQYPLLLEIPCQRLTLFSLLFFFSLVVNTDDLFYFASLSLIAVSNAHKNNVLLYSRLCVCGAQFLGDHFHYILWLRVVVNCFCCCYYTVIMVFIQKNFICRVWIFILRINVIRDVVIWRRFFCFQPNRLKQKQKP